VETKFFLDPGKAAGEDWAADRIELALKYQLLAGHKRRLTGIFFLRKTAIFFYSGVDFNIIRVFGHVVYF
jgi:hypothetical protein